MKTLRLLPVVLAASSLGVHAQNPIAHGHVDIGVAYELGAFDLHIHQAEPIDQEFAPDEAFFVLGPAAATTSPGGAYTGFLGSAGSPVWILPSTENESLPFLGFATEELVASDWLGDITLSVSAVTGPGAFSIWKVGTFGTPELLVNSTDGIGASDRLTLIPASHAHFTLGFTAPGTYEVTVQATGTHATDGLRTSDPATYRFEVVPEPSTWAMLVLGTGALLFIALRSRR